MRPFFRTPFNGRYRQVWLYVCITCFLHLSSNIYSLAFNYNISTFWSLITLCILPSLFYGRFYYFVLYNCSIETLFPLFHSCTKGNFHSESQKHMPGFWRSYLKLTAVINTNYGKTTRIPNILETGTLLKHGTDRNENFGNNFFLNGNKIFWVGRLTANKQYFNLGLRGHLWDKTKVIF